ncbi:MAG: ribosomal protein S18-alanine N-acetyltransferase [Actinomycetota bacterium]
MSAEWIIRPAERRDVPGILVIEESQFPEPWSKAMVLDEVSAAPNRRYSVAVTPTSLVGCLGLMFVEDEVHVNTIGTHPEWEGRGVARSLLDEGWNELRARGTRRATLEVAVSNTRAQALYRHYGFAPVGIRKNYYQRSGEDALVLWADLL